MVERRALRTRKQPSRLAIEDDSEDNRGVGSRSSQGSASSRDPSSAGSDAEDDWQPPSLESSKKGKSRSKRQRVASDSEDEESDDGDDDEVKKPGKPTAPVKKSRPQKETDAGSRPRAASPKGQGREVSNQPQDDENDEEITEEDRARLEKEAADMWDRVRKKKAGDASIVVRPPKPPSPEPKKTIESKTPEPRPASAASKTSLNAWLGLPPIPWPTSPPSAQVLDRDSLFIGFVYPITSCAPNVLAQHLQHLTTVVHPSLPASIFPSQFAHLDPKRRGSSHDMHAWRVLGLKTGRDGLGGPSDFGIEEGWDDDSERWGGEKIVKVMRNLGGVDLLVVVSRWYGGTNLGPVRFEHIATCAKEAIQRAAQEEVSPYSS
jgi:hypothetical protein